MIMTRVCIICPNTYIPTAVEQKVCSNRCRKQHAFLRQSRNRVARGGAISDHDFGQAECKECGTEFRKFDPAQVFCCPDHKEAYRSRTGMAKLRTKLEDLGIEWRSEK